MKLCFELKDVYLDHEGYLRKRDGTQLFYGVRTQGEHEAAESIIRHVAKTVPQSIGVTVLFEIGGE